MSIPTTRKCKIVRTLPDLRKRGDSNPRSLAGRSLSSDAGACSQGTADVLTCECSKASAISCTTGPTRTETQTETPTRRDVLPIAGTAADRANLRAPRLQRPCGRSSPCTQRLDDAHGCTWLGRGAAAARGPTATLPPHRPAVSLRRVIGEHPPPCGPTLV